MNVIIVDDQKIFRESLKDLLADNLASAILIGEFENPKDAIKAIKKQKPDLLFLDVEMPEMNGFELLKKISPVTFDVIFTTSHKEYSLDALRASAADFLVKPISQKEFKDALLRMKNRMRTNQPDHMKSIIDYLQNEKTPKDQRVGFPTHDGIIFIHPNDIVRFEASSNYSFMYQKDGNKKLVTKTLKEIELILNQTNFFRVHMSHLLNLTFIKKYMKASSYVVLSDGSTITVARNRKQAFLEQFSHF